MSTSTSSLETSARNRRTGIGLAVAAVVAAIAAMIAPDLTTGSGAMTGMSMTHYMGLLSVRQPWNLLLFMALPVILAETLAITELALLFNHAAPAWVRTLRRWAALLAGPVWVFITLHLLVHAVLPLSMTGGWRGFADVVAVFTYLAGCVPMIGVSLIEAGLIGHTPRERARLYVIFVAAFLVVAHVAMIFGMIDPAVFGWHESSSSMGGMDMSGMNHNHSGMGMPMPSATPSR